MTLHNEYWIGCNNLACGSQSGTFTSRRDAREWARDMGWLRAQVHTLPKADHLTIAGPGLVDICPSCYKVLFPLAGLPETDELTNEERGFLDKEDLT